MQAIILAIGDELVLGQTVDTNSAWLSEQLARRGVGTAYHQTVGDDERAIAQVIRQASMSAEVVLISGGLGPTDDDLTRQGLADAMGVELITDEPSLEAIGAFFAARGRVMPQRNAVQAMHPTDSTMIENSCGTAPGIRAQLNRATIYIMPGVPREMRVMAERSVFPEIERLLEASPASGRVILTTKINTFGRGESDVAEQLGELMVRDRSPTVGTTVAGGIVSVRVRSEASGLARAQAALVETAADVERRLGAIVFSREDVTLADVVLPMLVERGLRLATAESCTGGLIGKMITDVAGAGDAYAGGWVTYCNEMKMSELGVPESVLAEHGAVSEATAQAMARGAIERSGADLSLAVTGVAGPSGGTEAKPVGTVWIALGIRETAAAEAGEPGGSGGIRVEPLLFRLLGEREQVRDRSAKCALQMLRLHLMNVPLSELGLGRGWAVSPGAKA